MKICQSVIALAGILFLSLPLAGCAVKGDGTWEANISTVVEGIKQGRFILNEDSEYATHNPSANAITLQPGEGEIMLSGFLDSDGKYNVNGKKNYMDGSMAEIAGMEWNPGDCRFAAIIDEKTGEIRKAHLVYYGVGTRAHEFEGNLNDKLKGSYGKVEKNKFIFSVSGPSWDYSTGHEIEKTEEPTGTKGAVVLGKGNLLSAKNGDIFKVKLYLGVDAIPSKPPSKKPGTVVFGGGNLKVTR